MHALWILLAIFVVECLSTQDSTLDKLAELSRDAYCHWNNIVENHDERHAQSLAMPLVIKDKERDLQVVISATSIDNTPSIVVAFRGSRSAANWLSNFDIDMAPFRLQTQQRKQHIEPKALFHRGYLQSYKAISQQLMTKVQQMQRSIQRQKRFLEGRKIKIFFTGHSMGGAIAAIGAYDAGLKWGKNLVHLVMFGAPRVGNRSAAKEIEGAVASAMNVRTAGDPVPLLPTSGSTGETYAEVGRQIVFIDESGARESELKDICQGISAHMSYGGRGGFFSRSRGVCMAEGVASQFVETLCGG